MKLSEIDFSKNGKEYLIKPKNSHPYGDRVYTKDGDLLFKFNNKTILLYFTLKTLCEMDFAPAPIEIKVGDILETTNGKFKIVKIDTPEYPETPSYGAMFLDDCEIQYMSNRLERLLKDIMINCDLIDIIEC